MASRKELLSSIRPEMKLTKGFFIKVLGYDMATPGFAEDAIARLKIFGYNRAREHYTRITTEWQQEHDKMMKNVAQWYGKQDFGKKEVRKSRIQQETILQSLTKNELRELCQRLLQKGIIESPEQFATMVNQGQ